MPVGGIDVIGVPVGGIDVTDVPVGGMDVTGVVDSASAKSEFF